MRLRRAALFAMSFFGAGLALAVGPDVFSGETAAILDWSVKSCEFKSSDKTRKLVEDEKAKSEAKFTDAYMKGFSSKLLTEANDNREATTKLCAQIKEWYGNSGTRISGLVAGPSETIEPATSSKKDASSSGRGRRKRAQ